MMAIC